MVQDLRFALRQLLSARGFSLLTIVTLALAIGSNTAIFSAIDAVLLHPLSYPEPDQLVMVPESLPRYSLHGLAPSAADYSEFLRQVTCFSHISAVTGADALSVIGIYSVLTYVVDQRRREFGIRVALGASAANVLALVLRHGLIPVLVGLIAGIGGAVGLTRLLKGLLDEVSTTDPLTFGIVAIGVAAGSLTAMLIPAQRATAVDPAEVLRQW